MKHIVSITHNEALAPQLQLYDPASQAISLLDLPPGAQLGFSVSEEKTCVGYDDSTGEYHPCALSSKLRFGTQCRYCAGDDAYLPCLKCTGEVCLALPETRADCREMEMVVYLAGFGSEVKAGVSQAHRLMRRWLEQGADYATLLFSLKDGKEARRIEALLHRRGLAGYFTGKRKIQLLAADKEQGFAHFQEVALEMREDLAFGELEKTAEPEFHQFASHYPSFETPPEPTALLKGVVEGSKGNLLFLKQGDAGELRVLELNPLVGRQIGPQASLY